MTVTRNGGPPSYDLMIPIKLGFIFSQKKCQILVARRYFLSELKICVIICRNRGRFLWFWLKSLISFRSEWDWMCGLLIAQCFVDNWRRWVRYLMDTSASTVSFQPICPRSVRQLVFWMEVIGKSHLIFLSFCQYMQNADELSFCWYYARIGDILILWNLSSIFDSIVL